MLGLLVVSPRQGAGLPFVDTLEPLLGVPVLVRAILGGVPLQSGVSGVLVVPDEEVERAQRDVVEAFGLDEIEQVVGGATDFASGLQAGLAALGPEVTTVIVTEGARPLTPVGMVDRLVEASASTRLAVPAVLSTERHVQLREGRFVPYELPEGTYRLQGPLVAPVAMLRTCLREDPSCGSLDALARAGFPVQVIDGDPDNLPLRSVADMSRALEVFSRRAADLAFAFPKDLLAPDDVEEESSIHEQAPQVVEQRVPENDETTCIPVAPGPDVPA